MVPLVVLSVLRNRGRPKRKSSWNCFLESLSLFLVQAFGRFCDGTGRGSLELPKDAKHKKSNTMSFLMSYERSFSNEQNAITNFQPFECTEYMLLRIQIFWATFHSYSSNASVITMYWCKKPTWKFTNMLILYILIQSAW